MVNTKFTLIVSSRYVISYHLLKLRTSKFKLCNCLNLVIFLHNILFVLFK